MHPIWRFTLTAVAAAAIALAILAVPVLLRSDAEDPPGPTPAPGIRAVAREIRTAPDVPAATRAAAIRDIGGALKTLYERAFEQPTSTPEPKASPRPAPAARVRPSLTKIARSALAKEPKVFNEASDLSVYTGRVAFNGVITFDGKRPIEALLYVDFLGEAAPIGPLSPLVKVHQVGTVVMKRTADGWLMDGYDLRFATRPLPTPEPAES